MRTVIEVEPFGEMRQRKLARARKLDRREAITPIKRISFDTPSDMLACMTPQRLRLCEAAREKPRSVTDLALALERDRKAVHRDVKLLHAFGILSVRRESNPGHGQVTIVQTTASRFRLTAEI